MVPPEEQARERAEEADAEVGVGPPGEHAALDEDGPIGVPDEVVEVPGGSWHRVPAGEHRRLEVVVEEEGAGERRSKKERAEDRNKSKGGDGAAYKKVGACRYFALERLNVACHRARTFHKIVRSKSITLAVATLGSLFLALAAGCAGSTEEAPIVVSDGGAADAAPKADAGKSDAGSDGATKACVQTCQSDDDCGNSCPATPTGANCCDLATNTCYRAQSVCPLPDPTDSGPANPY